MWKNVSKEVLDKGQYIVPLKKVELQLEYAKALVKIDKVINAIDLVIELIKQQPTEDDSWILDRLNGFKIILEDKEV